MNNNHPLFYAKILLFGEYGIIEDSMGLSIPFNFYKGKILFADQHDPKAAASNESLRDFHKFLRSLEQSDELPCAMDLERFQQDLDAGIYFDSSIPQGFGVGSSGAVVAAIYDRYALNKPETDAFNQAESLLHLKMVFAKLESYFHGKSSGLDPLICYLNLPVLIRSREDLGTVGLPTENNTGKGGIFLLDTGSPGKTSSMVSIFLEKLKHDGFRNMIRQQLVKYNDECIKAFLNRDSKPLFYNLKELSKLFLENFRPMIPDSFEKLWKEGIESNAYFLKLCGSGGGGFILGFTQDLELAKSKLAGHNMEVIYRF
jgi:mevalonate kinase